MRNIGNNRALLRVCVLAAVGMVGGFELNAQAARVTKVDSFSIKQKIAIAPGNVGVGAADLIYVNPGQNGGPDQILMAPAGGGVHLTIVGREFGRTVVGPIASDGTTVHFKGVNEAGTAGDIFRVPVVPPSAGNIPITVQGSNFTGASGAPALPAGGSGPVVFKDVNAGGQEVVVARSSAGGLPITIFGQEFGSAFSRPAVNNTGDVAVVRVLPPVQGLAETAVLVRSSGGVVLTVQGAGFQASRTGSPVILDDEDKTVVVRGRRAIAGEIRPALMSSGLRTGYAAYQALAVDLVAAVGSGQGGLEDFQVSRPVAGQGRGGQTNILARYPNSGVLAMIDVTGGGAGGGLPTPLTLLSPGDAVDGSTIASIDIGENAYLSNGDAFVYLTLTDGSQGMYYLSIPEPGALSAMAAVAMGLLRRRR